MLQIKEIPPRPAEHDGALCLFLLRDEKGAVLEVDEAALRAALAQHGAITRVELTGTLRDNHGGVVVRFATHEAALAAKRAGPIAGVCAGVDTLYNERAYDERGWCCFEEGVSGEVVARLHTNPRLREAMSEFDVQRPKMLALCSGAPAQPIPLEEADLVSRVERVKARIQSATFTGKGDAEKVPQLYTDYVSRIADTLQPLLAVATTKAAVQLPSMPEGGASDDDVLAWHLEVMRLQHASIIDVLSGKRLDTRTECVQMALEGKGADGQPLDVRNVQALSAWLPRTSTGALLTAGPAAGKTWLLSQVVMHSLDGELVPILVEVQRLQKALAEHEAAFEEAPDWVDAYLRVTCKPAHYRVLHGAMAERRVLLLLDGLDEAGRERARIEAHVATILAPRGFVLLCTSRPTGLDEALFTGFHRLTLAPLSDVQQQAFLATRLTPARADDLMPYLRDKVPVDTETRQRVTSNPLMLSMVASIAELRTGIAMPTKTAELYDVAARAMLSRGEDALSAADAALLQATFFEAHTDQQRIITEQHLEAAARRLGGSLRTLRERVVQDRLPLLRVLQEEPLQMQAFHLSFQEFYAMRALAEGHARPFADFRVGDPWWTNAVLMGVQEGDAFGERFVEAAGLAPAGVKEWRSRLVTALAHAGIPGAWLSIVAEAAGAPADYGKLKKFVGRYRDVLQREGGKAVAQLVVQQPETGAVFDQLRAAPLQRLLVWRNKPQADPCIATFAHAAGVNSLAVSKSHIVGGAGKSVFVYDAGTEELVKQLESPSDVQSVAIFEGDEASWIAAGFKDGTIKVWDAGVDTDTTPMKHKT